MQTASPLVPRPNLLLQPIRPRLPKSPNSSVYRSCVGTKNNFAIGLCPGSLLNSDHRGRSMVDAVLGWFPYFRREWIEFIIAAILLCLLMMAAVSDPELMSVD